VPFALESPGKLYPSAASLLFWATRELIRWQTPVVAASELLAMLALLLRARILRTPMQPAGH